MQIFKLTAQLLAVASLASAASLQECGSQQYDPDQYYCLAYNGSSSTARGLCPKGAPCACPTPGAAAVGGAPFGCFNSTQYHCSQDQLTKTKNGLVQGSGTSTAGACPSHIGPNLIQNGGFETGVFSSWSLFDDVFSANNPSGIPSKVKMDPHTGTYAAALTTVSGGNVYLSQYITTPAGAPCTLLFWLKSDQPRPASAYFRVAFDGRYYQGEIISANQTANAGPSYAPYVGKFTGNGNSASLVFALSWGDDSGHYWGLDDVVAFCEVAG